jgi:hypothetical protein
MVSTFTTPRLAPPDGPAEEALAIGFRLGEKGTHTSRTMMLSELSALLAATEPTANREKYAEAVIEMNCLAKPTAISRRKANQRIGELYALDVSMPIFRVFRRLWDIEPAGRQLLAILCAIARDPLLAATAPAILSLPSGAELSRDAMTAAVREAVGDRLNENTIAKVGRNAASSWTQSGHLCGRTFKRRQMVIPTVAAVAFGLYLAHAIGFRGPDLFTSAWMALLDCSPASARQFAMDAKRAGLIDLRMAGDVIELNLDRLDPAVPRN